MSQRINCLLDLINKKSQNDQQLKKLEQIQKQNEFKIIQQGDRPKTSILSEELQNDLKEISWKSKLSKYYIQQLQNQQNHENLISNPSIFSPSQMSYRFKNDNDDSKETQKQNYIIQNSIIDETITQTTANKIKNNENNLKFDEYEHFFNKSKFHDDRFRQKHMSVQQSQIKGENILMSPLKPLPKQQNNQQKQIFRLPEINIKRQNINPLFEIPSLQSQMINKTELQSIDLNEKKNQRLNNNVTRDSSLDNPLSILGNQKDKSNRKIQPRKIQNILGKKQLIEYLNEESLMQQEENKHDIPSNLFKINVNIIQKNQQVNQQVFIKNQSPQNDISPISNNLQTKIPSGITSLIQQTPINFNILNDASYATLDTITESQNVNPDINFSPLKNKNQQKKLIKILNKQIDKVDPRKIEQKIEKQILKNCESLHIKMALQEFKLKKKNDENLKVQIFESYKKRVSLQNEDLEKEDEFNFKEQVIINEKEHRHKSVEIIDQIDRNIRIKKGYQIHSNDNQISVKKINSKANDIQIFDKEILKKSLSQSQNDNIDQNYQSNQFKQIKNLEKNKEEVEIQELNSNFITNLNTQFSDQISQLDKNDNINNQTSKDQALEQNSNQINQQVDIKIQEKIVYETFLQKKARENIEDYHQIRQLPEQQRKQKIMEKSLKMNDIDYDIEEQKKKMYDFMVLLKTDNEYPLNIINKLIILTTQKIEKINEKSEYNQIMSQNEIINGLCLLKCMKHDNLKEILLSQTPGEFEQNSKDILKAAQLVKDLQIDKHKKESDMQDDPFKNLRDIIDYQNESEQYTYDDTQEEEDYIKQQNQEKIFGTSLFKKVMEGIVENIESKNNSINSKSKNLAELNQLQQELKQVMIEIVNSDSNNLNDLTARYLEIKKQINHIQELIMESNKLSVVQKAGISMDEKSAQNFAYSMNLKHEFFQICKAAFNPKVEQDLQNNPILNFQQNCQQNFTLISPVLKFIINRSLIVQNYQLSDGSCSAISDAFKGNSRLINQIYLENNSISDQEFGVLLKGALSQECIRQITYKKNIFQSQSLENLVPILSRRKPKNLEEFNLIDCKINSTVQSELINNFLYNSTGIKKLSLINANITANSFQYLCEFVKECRSLVDLNLSYNGFRPSQMFDLIKILKDDRKLVNVNLSWNSFLIQELSLAPSGLEGYLGKKQSQKQKNEVERTLGQFSAIGQQALMPERFNDFQIIRQSIMSQINEQEENQIEDIEIHEQNEEITDENQEENKKDQTNDYNPMNFEGMFSKPVEKKKSGPKPGESMADFIFKQAQKKQQKFIKDLGKYLCEFIKYNQNLVHFDLTSTGLNDDVINEIGISLNKAKSLCSIHLSNNPGVSQKNIEFIQNRIRSKKLLFQIKDITSQKQQFNINFNFSDQINKNSNIEIIQENLKIQDIKNRINLSNHNDKMMNSFIENKLDIIRILGHQYDMPGSQQWCIHNNNFDHNEMCWICEQSIHTLIFWNSSLSKFQSINDVIHKQKIINQIQKKYPFVEPMENTASEDKLNQRLAQSYELCKNDRMRPLISCEYTNWKPTRMLRVEEYTFNLEQLGLQKIVDLYDISRVQNLINKNQTHKDYKLLNDIEQQNFESLKQKTQEKYQRNWSQIILDKIRYKKPFFCNLNYLKNQQIDDLYVFPCFLKPGKQNYLIVQKENLANNQNEQLNLPVDTQNYFIYQCIAENRNEEIPQFKKPFKQGKKERVFNHETSLFRSWRPDNQQTLQACLDHDFQYCKLHRFVKPAETEIPKVKDVITKYFDQIKQIYHYLISKSNFPGIGWQDYTNWVISIKVLDENYELSAVDRDYTAAIFIEDKIENSTNPTNALSRFQFIEILCRMAKNKYEEKGKPFQHSIALEKLINEIILKNDQSDPWQKFRNLNLWTFPVCDLLEPNMPGLMKVYQSHFKSRKQFMDLLDCYDLFIRKTGLLKLEKHVMYCFGMSKMTVVDEVKQGQKYFQLSFIEFVELIGRIAHLKFKDDPDFGLADMQTKIEIVLDKVLEQYQIKRLDPVIVIVNESESDDDY